jgi:dynein heavy chain
MCTTVIQNTIPKERAAQEAEEELQKVQAKAKALEDQFNKKKEQLDEQTTSRSSRNVRQNHTHSRPRGSPWRRRWTMKSAEYEEEKTSVVGDVLLSAAFVSYSGPFTRAFRELLRDDI